MITIPVGFLASQGTLGYGKLYNSYAVNLANFTPAGWHLPALSEYTTLGTTIGSNPGTHMKVPPPYKWNGVVPGDNSSGFSLYGAGSRNISGAFDRLKEHSYLWVTDSSQFNQQFSYVEDVNSNLTSGNLQLAYGRSVRIIKDNDTDPGTLTDEDGNIYDTVKIGSQVWIVQNWKCTSLNDGTPIPEITDTTDWENDEDGAWCYYLNNPQND